MTLREQRIAIAAGVLGGAAALYYGGKSLFVAPLLGQQKAISAADGEITKLEARKKLLQNSRSEWARLASRTLEVGADRAHSRFREDILNALEAHGFTKRDLTVKALSAHKFKDGSIELPLTVNTKGKLKDLVALLVDLARREYLLRIDMLSITAPQGREATAPTGRNRSSATTRAAPDAAGPDLAIVFTATTLALPKIDDIPHRPASQPGQSERGRLPRDPADYEQIVAANIFAEYVPPPPVAATQAAPPVAANPNPPDVAPTTPPPPDPRKDAAHFTVKAAVTGRDAVPEAWVYDDRQNTEPPRRIKLNELIDDGVLVLVHTRGIVVRSTQGSAAGSDYFYKVGACFTDRVPVAEANADVQRDLKLALREQ